MKKPIALLLLIALLSCNTSEKQKDLPLIDFQKIVAGESTVPLSNIADQINYILLDSVVPIQMLNTLEFADNMFFAGTSPEGLLVYDNQGNLIRKIGKRGSGPGEYSYGSAFTLDRENKKVYLLDRSKILVYNFNGDFQREIPLQKFEGDFTDICFSDGLIYLIEYISFGNAKYNWLVISPEGIEISAKYNTIPSLKSEIGGFGGATFCNNQLYYLNGVNDTLFVADSKSCKPYALVNWGAINSGTAEQNQGTAFNLLDMLKTKQYLFFRYFLKEGFYTVCFDAKNSRLMSVASAKNINHRDGGPGLKNDLDSGLPFVPKFYFEKEDKEYIAAYVFPFELREHVASAQFKSSTPLYPEKKKALEQLANSLDENDNPVLMLVKLKE